jgi:hypothetical protein
MAAWSSLGRLINGGNLLQGVGRSRLTGFDVALGKESICEVCCKIICL